jgi:hypothetical protein
MTVTTIETIKRNHPVRNAFAGRSSGNGSNTYYASKGHAVNAFDNELQGYNLCLDRNDLADFVGNEGRKIIDIHNEFDKVVGCAVFTWFRMESGNYEFVGYIS